MYPSQLQWSYFEPEFPESNAQNEIERNIIRFLLILLGSGAFLQSSGLFWRFKERALENLQRNKEKKKICY